MRIQILSISSLVTRWLLARISRFSSRPVDETFFKSLHGGISWQNFRKKVQCGLMSLCPTFCQEGWTLPNFHVYCAWKSLYIVTQIFTTVQGEVVLVKIDNGLNQYLPGALKVLIISI